MNTPILIRSTATLSGDERPHEIQLPPLSARTPHLLRELQRFVDGYIEIVRLGPFATALCVARGWAPEGETRLALVVNEEGRLRCMPHNPIASDLGSAADRRRRHSCHARKGRELMAQVQRWRAGSHCWRPAGEVINVREYEVAPIASDAVAKAFVLAHHYAATYPAARWRFGLWHHAQLVGVAVFSVPARAEVLTSCFPGDFRDSVELGRFVLLDAVPANGETFFLGRAFAGLRPEGLHGVVSFSDPVPRTDISGRVIFPGHVGTIYQAHNAQYCGLATARTLRLLPDGAVLSDRAIQKVRAWERGAASVVDKLLAAGAPPFTSGARRSWLTEALSVTTRRLRHGGNHRYAWPLTRRYSVALPALPYPKVNAGGLS